MGLLLGRKILGYEVDHMGVNTEPEYQEIKQSDKIAARPLRAGREPHSAAGHPASRLSD